MSEKHPHDEGSTADKPTILGTPDEGRTSGSGHPGLEAWEFPGWGTAERIEDLDQGPVEVHSLEPKPTHKLGQLEATAICGNDITSSCLYVSAFCAAQAGKYAPLALLVVAAVLYLFRRIYGEVVTALPLNGGAYNVLLNTTSKAKASLAACLTILSYVATAVISAGDAMHYLAALWTGLNVNYATVVLLSIFAFLNVVGITESAKVAVGIFIFHISTLTLMVILTAIKLIGDPSMLTAAWHAPAPHGYGFLKALFFGFAAALLGISGFESSANFVEEQKPGVFLKTLRNMWGAVSFFNPLIAVLALGLLSLHDIDVHKEQLLAEMGQRTSGAWLRTLVCIDAVMVLSGAVLTSYVGVTGLVRRMSLDRCLPQFLLKTNKWRNTNHWIIIGFLAVCISIILITEGEIIVLAGVYTLSFLSVMALFAVGNMLLKVKRARLPREVRASWPGAMVALAAVVTGIVGTALMKPEYLQIFGIYISVVVLAVALMFMRIQLLKVALNTSRLVMERVRDFNRRVFEYVTRKIGDINSLQVIFFSNGDNLADLNNAAVYVMQNEQTRRLLVVHVYEEEDKIPSGLGEQLATLDKIYPQLRIDFLAIKGHFGP
ncbi:MAG: APC family permease, partial [Myxococcales bacterium]|nr:APC family permease [Myxococcales bacterium]